ncbi:MAG: IS200/IS605 family element transposase accessory protein TnpB, partial [Parasporobacterium sp.]|nr:IS200/IS605 family element transposase accessory protein TnpB [Parasporobacterium sp.]
MAQQILKEVDGSFKSFFGLKRLAGQGDYSYDRIRLPGYLPKDGYATLIIAMVRTDGNHLHIPYSTAFKKSHAPVEITIPPVLKDRNIKEIRIIPKADAGYFELQYTYVAEQENHCLDPNKAMSLDLGVNNLVTAVTSEGKSLIIDGRRIKAVNQWYNKENSRLQGIRDRQDRNNTHNPNNSDSSQDENRKQRRKLTKRQSSLLRKRNNVINDYMSKTARIIIDTCIMQGIGKLVVGCNEGFQHESRMGKRGNQNFVQIPYGKLRSKLKYLCELNGIEYTEQEESYTSKASFWDRDEIPVYKEKDEIHQFSGRRVRRGVYETADGRKINADVNAALNILRKSKVVSLTGLYNRGEVDTP